jgi:hypothetical protein
MVKALTIVTCALAFALTVVPMAQADDIKGTILKIEQPANVIVFEDGRMFQVSKETVYTIDNKTVTFTDLTPGRLVIMRQARPVQLKEGKYIIIEGSPSALPRN